MVASNEAVSGALKEDKLIDETKGLKQGWKRFQKRFWMKRLMCSG